MNTGSTTRVISVTSGKGGVGKTSLVTNMAYRLAQNGKRVLIFDGDLGMANVDIMFGAKPKGNILEVLRGEKKLSDILTEGAKNIHIIPGGSGIFELSHINAFERRQLLDSVESLPSFYDYMLIDTAPGLSDNVLYLNAAAEDIIVLITPDPSSLADAYALIKTLNQRNKIKKFRIICNQVKDDVEGFGLYKRFSEVCERFLDVGLDFLGSIPTDPVLKRATQHQRIIMRHEPQSNAAHAIVRIVNNIGVSPSQIEARLGFMGFWNQVVGVA